MNRLLALATLCSVLAATALALPDKAPADDCQQRILAAARERDGERVMAIISESLKSDALGKDGVEEMLVELGRNGEREAFVTLLDQIRMTALSKDWQPNDSLLNELIAEERKDFLDDLLARDLDLARLESLSMSASPEMAQWLTQRAEKVRKQRAEQDELVTAAGKGDLGTMKRLLDAGVDINCAATTQLEWESARSHRPLTLASREDKLDAVKLLLERGAKVDLPKHPGWDYTPLCFAKSTEVADLLKAAGANVHAKLFRRDVSILTYSARFNGAKMVKWFLEQGLDPRMIGDNQQTLLFDAGDAETTLLLLEAGLDPNHVDEFGRTPIMEARDGETVSALVKHGAKVTGLGEPLLPRMAHSASGEAIEAAIQGGAEATPEILERCLVSAAHVDRPDVARVVLKRGVNPNKELPWDAAGIIKQVPLMTCCVHGSPKTAKVLIEHGADPNYGDIPGALIRTALRNGHKETAAILREAGAKGVSDLEYAVAMEDADRTAALLADLPNYSDAPDFWGDTLSAAARLGNLTVVRAALDHGVPVQRSKGENATSAVYAAAFEGQHEVLQVILAHGDKPFEPSKLRQALWAAVWNSNPYPEQRTVEHFEKTIQLLLDAGAPVDEADSKNNLMAAAIFTRYPGGNPRVIEMLVKAGADPNPLLKAGDKEVRLMESVETVCEAGGCSVPTASVLKMLRETIPQK